MVFITMRYAILCYCLPTALSAAKISLKSGAAIKLKSWANNQALRFTITAGLISASLFASAPQAALANIGEGDLPSGAMAFSKILKYQNDWDKLAGAIQERGSEMEERELLNMKFFFKQLANEYSDLELLASGIMDKSKQDQAIGIAKKFRQEMRQCDDAAGEGKIDKILEIYPRTKKELIEFLDLLRDVPDEI